MLIVTTGTTAIQIIISKAKTNALALQKYFKLEILSILSNPVEILIESGQYTWIWLNQTKFWQIKMSLKESGLNLEDIK